MKSLFAARLALALGLVFVSQPSIRADWTVSSLERKPGAAPEVEYRHYSLGETSGERTEVHLAVFATRKVRVRIIDQPGSEKELAEIMMRDNFIAGVNGGYFDPEGKPVGLLRSDGKDISPFARARLLSGVLAAGPAGVELFRANVFSQKRSWREALQCGPFLIDRGRPIAGLDKTRRARRTFVATSAGREAALGFCAPVTLAQLAAVVAALSDLRATRAMNLDGGSSSAFWCLTKDGAVSVPGWKNVRDFVALEPASR